MGADNDTHASCHLVRVNPGGQRDDHIHDKAWEYNQVIEGTAIGYLDQTPMPFRPGVIAVIPCGVSHKVVAGENSIVILATFLQALM